MTPAKLPGIPPGTTGVTLAQWLAKLPVAQLASPAEIAAYREKPVERSARRVKK